MTTPLAIRRATRKDSAEITRLHAAGWREGYGSFFEPQVIEQAIQERRKRWSDLLSESDLVGTLLFVAEQNGTIVAFAHTGPAQEHPGDTEIYSFYADPHHWGTGVARELMHHLLLFARTRDERIYLSTFSGSTRARRFYEKLGFRETGRTTESHFAPDVTMINIEYVHDGNMADSLGI